MRMNQAAPDCIMRIFCLLLTPLFLAACAVSPLGHHQLHLFSSQELAQMGVASYQKIKEKTPVDSTPSVNHFVQCVAHAITNEAGGGPWVVTVFNSKQVNAFAIPGGKIGVYTGLLKVVKNQAQLAAVLGHETGHVLAHHMNARMSTQLLTGSVLQVASSIVGGGATGQAAMAALGLGAQVGVLLPYSRSQESEADAIGLKLMAKAGFDPHQAVNLWQNMQQLNNGKQPPELLSTHPADSHRIADLRKRMPAAEQLFQQARAAGRHPHCGQP